MINRIHTHFLLASFSQPFFLASLQETSPCGMLDMTNPNATKWLVQKLQSLLDGLEVVREDKKSDLKLPQVAFFLDTGDFTNIPHYYEFNEPLENPDVSRDIFVDVVMKHFPVIGVNGVSQRCAQATYYKSDLDKII